MHTWAEEVLELVKRLPREDRERVMRAAQTELLAEFLKALRTLT